jgi:hypothetical protein
MRNIITSRPNKPTDSYVFEAHERPFMAGSPATPQHSSVRRIGYFLIGIYIALAGGLQNGLLLANLTDLQSSLALTPVEAGWVTAASSYGRRTSLSPRRSVRARAHWGGRQPPSIYLRGYAWSRSCTPLSCRRELLADGRSEGLQPRRPSYGFMVCSTLCAVDRWKAFASKTKSLIT